MGCFARSAVATGPGPVATEVETVCLEMTLAVEAVGAQAPIGKAERAVEGSPDRGHLDLTRRGCEEAILAFPMRGC